MATILKFEPRTGERLNIPPMAGPGEVVIFPGVRMERHDFLLSDRLEPEPDNPGIGQRSRRSTRK